MTVDNKEKLKALSEHRGAKLALKIGLVLVWCVIIVFCFLNRGKITVDEIIRITPSNTALAIVIMLVIFALKSVTVVIYCGLIYIACGLIFPLPLAIAVNIIGSAIMVTIPFFIGRYTGGGVAEKILKKYPNLAEVKAMREKNDFFIAFFVRIIGLLPSDPISSYMGAIGLDYKKYLAGTLLGMLPSLVAFPIMGMSIATPSSPAFIGSVTFTVSVSIISLSAYTISKHRKKKEKK